ncbi:MAG: MFS transporter, partial [Bacteroidaceae bacterium]|nr:MFS transporter [Bacteroidaceae bacterium]
MKTHTKINPWLWIPTLYFAEGIPYFIVNSISVTLFTRMGVPNGEMALFTSLLYLPWTIKPLWSPFVDIFKTKRWWILAMQLFVTILFVLTTLSIPHPDKALIEAGQTPVSLFTVCLILFVFTAFSSATHDIAADGFYMLALNQKEQSFFVGIRSTFYRLSSIFGQGVLVLIAGILETQLDDIPMAWSITLAITALIFAITTIWHTFFLPKPTTDVSSLGADRSIKAGEIWREFGRTFATYFQKRGVLLAISFMLLYRLPEAFLLKLVNPFLLDSHEKGGLALSTAQVGLVYGTMGVLALTVGGIVGGIASSRWGLKKSLWPMAMALGLPCFAYVYLSMFTSTNLWIVGMFVAIEQFGYG